MVKFEQETTNNWNTVNQAMGLEYTSLSTPKPIESDIGVILAITGDQELSFSSDVLFNVQGGMIISVDGPNISRRHSSSVISSSFTRNSYSYFHYIRMNSAGKSIHGLFTVYKSISFLRHLVEIDTMQVVTHFNERSQMNKRYFGEVIVCLSVNCYLYHPRRVVLSYSKACYDI